MCQHYISLKKRLCGNKEEPYCHLHRPKIVVSNVPVKLESDKCLICMEKPPYTIPCGHLICKKCIIFLDRLVCPFCRCDLHADIDQEMKEYRDHFEILNKRIYDLDNDNRAFVNAYNKLEEDYRKLLEEFETMVIISQYIK